MRVADELIVGGAVGYGLNRTDLGLKGIQGKLSAMRKGRRPWQKKHYRARKQTRALPGSPRQ
jgi:hypothetical protein